MATHRGGIRARRRTRVHADLHHQLDLAPLHTRRFEHLGQQTQIRPIAFRRQRAVEHGRVHERYPRIKALFDNCDCFLIRRRLCTFVKCRQPHRAISLNRHIFWTVHVSRVCWAAAQGARARWIMATRDSAMFPHVRTCLLFNSSTRLSQISKNEIK